MSKLLICYRTGDAAASAERLYDRAVARFGADRVVLADPALEFGEAVSGAVARAVEGSVVLLVVIGPRWLDARDRAGRRMLENADDWVRSIVAAALEKAMRIVPVLVDGAGAPLRSELPEAIGALADRHACEISPPRFDTEADHLLSSLAGILTLPPPLPTPDGTAPVAEERPGPGAPPPDPPGRPLLDRRDAATILRMVLLVLGARIASARPDLFPHVVESADSYKQAVLDLMLSLGVWFGLVVTAWDARTFRELLRLRTPALLAVSVATALLAAGTSFYLRGSRHSDYDLYVVPIVGAVYLASAQGLVLGRRAPRVAAAAIGAVALYLPCFLLSVPFVLAVVTWQSGYLLGMFGPLGAWAERWTAAARERRRALPAPG